MKKTGLNRYVYEFNVDYRTTDSISDIIEIMPSIHDYLVLKYKIK